MFKERFLDIDRVTALVRLSDAGLDFIQGTMEGMPESSPNWTFIFRDHYEVLRSLIEAYLLLDGVSADSHQCNNAWLCYKHPELGLSWDFLELVRLKRNSINYKGKLIDFHFWSEVKLKLGEAIILIRREICRKTNIS